MRHGRRAPNCVNRSAGGKWSRVPIGRATNMMRGLSAASLFVAGALLSPILVHADFADTSHGKPGLRLVSHRIVSDFGTPVLVEMNTYITRTGSHVIVIKPVAPILGRASPELLVFGGDGWNRHTRMLISVPKTSTDSFTFIPLSTNDEVRKLVVRPGRTKTLVMQLGYPLRQEPPPTPSDGIVGDMFYHTELMFSANGRQTGVGTFEITNRK
jgi:hypothetical protein